MLGFASGVARTEWGNPSSKMAGLYRVLLGAGNPLLYVALCSINGI